MTYSPTGVEATAIKLQDGETASYIDYDLLRFTRYTIPYATNM